MGEARRTFQNSQKPDILQLIWAMPTHLPRAFLTSYTDLRWPRLEAGGSGTSHPALALDSPTCRYFCLCDPLGAATTQRTQPCQHGGLLSVYLSLSHHPKEASATLPHQDIWLEGCSSQWDTS